ncbi:Fic family protein [Natrinema salinisoli]|uniref:Fic family protein n=1 Tax=Natrinema salinisoli TaxID=2878535 RepID=UPI001CF09DC7|nr:Fic family protein [Natrinema salinisoli]
MIAVNIRKYIEESNKIEGVHEEQAVEDSLDAWQYLRKQERLTHEVIRQTHLRIMERRQPDIAGEYRDCRVYVGGHVPPEPEQVKQLMTELLGAANRPETPVDALRWHVRFEKIHPFADGNGRVGRMLYWWHCHQLGVTPILFRARDRNGYYGLFQEVDTDD